MPVQRSDSEAESQDRFEDLSMRVAMGSYKPLTDDLLQLMKQLGVEDVLLTPHRHSGFDSAMPMGRAWTYDEITSVQDRIESHGLRLFAFEKMPIPLYEILLGDENGEEKTEAIKTTIRNLGRAGVPVLGYSGHPPDGAVRTSRTVEIRGGAEASAFSDEHIDDETLLYDREYDEEEIWSAYEEYLSEILPVAEEAGVTLGVHPSDPPVEKLGGVPLLFRNFENFKRVMNLVPSDNHGLKFCLGCWSEMGEDIPDVLRHFGGENIVYVHFRDVVGTVPEFHETFLDDEASNFDEFEVMETLQDIGFSGVMTPDHVPAMEGDTDWEFGSVTGRTYTVGYLKGLLKGVQAQQR
ncbi:mannonate dehydratase [Halomicrococcus sp. NG-SE-24]|uniref:mannonate dehydratase n=1 Tax=Halomicrococcus sp. NG-SE-24 TaxID=3436928 RepID=UPI003D99A4D8